MDIRLILKRFIKILIFILAAIIQFGFISALPSIFSHLNLIIISLILFLILYDFKLALYLTLLFGFLIDIHSSNFFGINIITLVSAIVITSFFLWRFFTNKSIYSFISLTIIAIVSYELLRASILFLINFIIKDISYKLIFSTEFFLNLIYEVAVNVTVVFVMFYFINYFSRKLKPMFVARNL